MKPKLLSQGAEAKIFLTKENTILKQRVPKSYRHPKLDINIRTKRTKSEAKNLTRALNAKVNVPKLLHTDSHDLQIEYIKGDKLSETLNSYDLKTQLSIIKKLSIQVSKLHANNIIHSDLTTSNIILQKFPSFSEAVYLIDFGLSYISTKIEDKAVDLHLLKQALQAKHHKTANQLFKEFEKSYLLAGSPVQNGDKWQDASKVLERLKTVEKRGRYKH